MRHQEIEKEGLIIEKAFYEQYISRSNFKISILNIHNIYIFLYIHVQ